MSRYLLLLLVALGNCPGHESLRILGYFPIPWKSHQFVFQQLVWGLAEKGHEVHLYAPVQLKTFPDTVKLTKVRDMLEEGVALIDYETFKNAYSWQNTKINFQIVEFMVESYLKSAEFKELLRSNETYDIVLTESALFAEPLAYVAHRFNALNVIVAPMLDHPWVSEISGLPDNPAYALSFQSRTNDKMDFLERALNVGRNFLINLYCYWETATVGQSLADKHITYEGWEGRPPLLDMLTDAALILVNSHPSFAYPRPRAPHVKEIGGIHITAPQPVPDSLKSFMNSATDGVIYFSMGTVLNTKALVESGLFKVFVNVFKTLKQKVLWKVSDGMPEVDHPNIRMETWFPQQDVLGDPNVVLFITHGGLQSMVETICFGVPTIGIPGVFDQFKDVKYMSSIGMGLELMLDNVTEATLSWTINEVLSRPRYREEAKRRRAMFNDRPLKPLDEAIYWIEYVGRNGKVLQSAATRMPFYKLYLLDVTAAFLVSVLIMWYVALSFIRYCRSYYGKLVSHNEKKSKQS